MISVNFRQPNKRLSKNWLENTDLYEKKKNIQKTCKGLMKKLTVANKFVFMLSTNYTSVTLIFIYLQKHVICGKDNSG